MSNADFFAAVVDGPNASTEAASDVIAAANLDFAEVTGNYADGSPMRFFLQSQDVARLNFVGPNHPGCGFE